jgi:hypothetical protein
MGTHSINRLKIGNPMQAKTSLRRRVVGIPVVRGRRTADRRFASATSAPDTAQILSIEETIARYVDQNPAQLYRGGA